MAAPFNLSKPNRPVRAGVILLSSRTEVLDLAPLDLLGWLSKEFAGLLEPILGKELVYNPVDVEYHWVNERGDMAKLTGGITLQPTDSFASCPPLDIVLMGAQEIDYEPTVAELDFIRKSYDDCSAFITICGGFQAPFKAGLFKNKTVTAPRFLLNQLRQMAPETQWVEERWHRDGKLWTSGALLNGLDLMRAFGTEYWGGEGTLMQYAIELGHWPRRDKQYGDAESKL